MHYRLLTLGINLGMGLIMSGTQITLALPPPEDIPEEVLRTEIILEGRSQMTGEPLSPAEYAQLQQELEQNAYPPQLKARLQHLIFLLRVRKMLKIVIPFF
ncbi:hypothetical protein PCC7424_1225 [Gloeothece citriformis PCC 7424]|uniref:Glutathione S-transferase n=1 Tax=Gloeothece citriformis (strain PCC 7424) TaxID=65393 RepID=B7K7A5_GLOC7|nr:hypothetical protein [Gloeothece citriformis]ACK69673.1 hypothetical protein PCC7424_1225 [Gloeothece citriformis PCC 7424]